MQQNMEPEAREIVLDVCGLQPPEPMEQIMSALGTLEHGWHLRVIIDRQPFPLYSILERSGYEHSTRAFDAHRFEIRIWRNA